MDAIAAGNYAADRLAGFGIHMQRFVLHALLHFKAAERLRRVGGFVNVNWHIYSAARDCSFGAAAFSFG